MNTAGKIAAVVTVVSGLFFLRDQTIRASLVTTDYDEVFEAVARDPRFPNVKPALLKGIAKQESDFRPDAEGPEKAISGSKSYGLMQILYPQDLPALSRKYGVRWPPEDPQRLKTDVRYNVTVAAAILEDNIRRSSSLSEAVALYNDSDPQDETPDTPAYDNQQYVNNVFRYTDQYRGDFE